MSDTASRISRQVKANPALHGLMILAAGAVCFHAFQDNGRGAREFITGKCVYQVATHSRELGCVFSDEPLTSAKLLARFGIEPRACADGLRPCGSRVVVGADGNVQVYPLPGTTLVTLGRPLDLNRATLEDLCAVPGVGPKLAGAIVETRRSLDRFTCVEDLRKTPGIGMRLMEKLRPFVTVSDS